MITGPPAGLPEGRPLPDAAFLDFFTGATFLAAGLRPAAFAAGRPTFFFPVAFLGASADLETLVAFAALAFGPGFFAEGLFLEPFGRPRLPVPLRGSPVSLPIFFRMAVTLDVIEALRPRPEEADKIRLAASTSAFSSRSLLAISFLRSLITFFDIQFVFNKKKILTPQI